MRIVFMGSSEFAVPSLRLLQKAHDVLCVYSQPMRPSGRGMKLNPTPIHKVADELGLAVRTPETLENEVDYLRDLGADVLVVVAYGLLIPQVILDLFPCGGVNVHPSLLPRWRGAAPIERCIEAGDMESGVSIIRMVSELDAGAILLQERVVLDDAMDSVYLHGLFSGLGSDLLLRVLDGGDFIGEEQVGVVTYANKWLKSESLLDFGESAMVLARRVRAASSLGGCYFMDGGERIKVWRVELGDDVSSTWEVICGDGCKLHLREVQKSGKDRQLI